MLNKDFSWQGERKLANKSPISVRLCKIRCWAWKTVIVLKEGEEKSGKGKEEDYCEGGKGGGYSRISRG